MTGLRGNRGFTLIELLTAMIIALVLATAIYETLNAGVKSNRKGNLLSRKNQTARLVMDFIESDLMTVSLSSSYPNWTFTATTYSEGSMYQDTLEFIAMNQVIDWNIGPTSDSMIVRYAMDTMPDTGKTGLIRVVNPYVTYPESENVSWQMISPDVVSLHFQYYDGSEWLEEWTDTAALPKQISITIGITDDNSDEGVAWYTTSLRLPKG